MAKVHAQDPLPPITGDFQPIELSLVDAKAIVASIARIPLSSCKFHATMERWDMTEDKLIASLHSTVTQHASGGGDGLKSADLDLLPPLGDLPVYQSVRTVSGTRYTIVRGGAEYTHIRLPQEHIVYYQDMQRIIRAKPNVMQLESIPEITFPMTYSPQELDGLAKFSWRQVSEGFDLKRYQVTKPGDTSFVISIDVCGRGGAELLRSMSLSFEGGNSYSVSIEYAAEGQAIHVGRVISYARIAGQGQRIRRFTLQGHSYDVGRDDLVLRILDLQWLQDDVDLSRPMQSANDYERWPAIVKEMVKVGQ